MIYTLHMHIIILIYYASFLQDFELSIMVFITFCKIKIFCSISVRYKDQIGQLWVLNNTEEILENVLYLDTE